MAKSRIIHGTSEYVIKKLTKKLQGPNGYIFEIFGLMAKGPDG